MKCLEILINGKTVCVAGFKHINQLQATITQGVENIAPHIAVNGARQTDVSKFEYLEWLKQPLSENDVLTIRFVECDQSTQPVTVQQIDKSDSHEEYEQKVAEAIAKLRMSKNDSDLNS